MDTHTGVPRIHATGQANPILGTVQWAPVKSLWLAAMTVVALIAGPITLAWDTAAVFIVSCAITLCLGHSLGMHRRLIHNSYQCPLWLEYFFVYCGTLVGMAGPVGMVRTHDMRDWAQRQPQCHDYFAQAKLLA
jgi:fatty-acid desaturase